MSGSDALKTVHRKDYAPPNFRVEQVALHVILDAEATEIRATLHLQRLAPGPLRLEAVDMDILKVDIADQPPVPGQYERHADHCLLHDLPSRCTVGTSVRINPSANTALEGLYRSGGQYTTQCEAEGFRKITPFPDRPDVLSVYTVTIDAERKVCPVLLSNGNLVDTTDLDAGWHRATWHDPFPKPSYLFALVAGDLKAVERRFITRSGREVLIQIYVREHDLDRCEIAADALERAMRWDETRFGLEYDLDRFMIVAVDDFNMGAMENKGLNIFNSRYVLGDASTATDTDVLGIEAVIAHEYFHNWTGNRITCRDWFQLSLKEGLTVFRDQEFTADERDRAVKRIQDVRLLRGHQFAEDAGPMAHPIRPESYVEINNFYTVTVYEKGAEVVRMLHTLLGDELWHKGMALYVERHDGTAASCEDFVAAMEAASGRDLTQFRRWYEQAGTPRLQVNWIYDASARQATLHLSQHTPDTPGQTDKPPLHMPVRLALYTREGQPIPVDIGRTDGDGALFELEERTASLVFEDLDEAPDLSLLRGFSAPVQVQFERSTDSALRLLQNDRDSFSRWEAAQALLTQWVGERLDHQSGLDLDRVVAALSAVLKDSTLSDAFKAEVLDLPGHDELKAALPHEQLDPLALEAARESMCEQVASALRSDLVAVVEAHIELADTAVDFGTEMIGRRRLVHVALERLSWLPSENWQAAADTLYRNATGMSDQAAALSVLCHESDAVRDAALAQFHERWHAEPLLLDKWFAFQARARHSAVIDEVTALKEHSDWCKPNPNRVRALIGAFSHGNPRHFHARDGRGYAVLADTVIEQGSRNPQLAARLIEPLLNWRGVDQASGERMRQQLLRIAANGFSSPDVAEKLARAEIDAGQEL